MSSLARTIHGMSLGEPEVGQTFYVVDGNYRTQAQGWWRPDRTGPLDLFDQKHPGYVYRTDKYSSDRNAIQAAIDAMIDYRGDLCFFTPGSYSIATTALALNVANARYQGPKVGDGRRSVVTITDAIGDNVISTDDNEFSFLKFVPLTAQNFFACAAGNRAWFHHFYYNADGIAASTSTEFVNTTAAVDDWMFEDFAVQVDAAQGDFLTAVSPQRWVIRNGIIWVEGGTWASAITFGTTPIGNLVDNIHVLGSGASSALTNFYTGATNKDMQITMTRVFVNGTLMSTASAIETGCGTTGDIDIAECYQTGDATGEGGVSIALA